MFDVWKRLAEATTFVELATIVCEEGRARLGAHHICVTLHDPEGRPIVLVDCVPEAADDHRRAWIDTEMWRADPLLRALCAHRAPVGDAHTLLLPLVEPSALIGSIRCTSPVPYSDDQRRDLAALATHVSVRLAQLGIAIAEPRLTPRQLEVAELAARGLSNLEVATMLAISENTVKKQLKEIYRRLDVANRTELVRVLRRPACTPAEVPIGVTRTNGVTITRRAG